MNSLLVCSALKRKIETYGYTVTLDVPGEGFVLSDSQGDVVEQFGANEDEVNDLCLLLEYATTEYVDCEGPACDVALRLLEYANPIASSKAEWKARVASLLAVFESAQPELQIPTA